MRIGIVILLALCLSAASGQTVTPQSNKYEVAGIDDPRSVEDFLRSLQQAVAKNERARVATMLNYPVTVIIRGRKLKLKNKADFLRRYNVTINHKVKQAIADQKPDDLFVNYQGVMIGGGEIWFGQPYESKQIKVIAINN